MCPIKLLSIQDPPLSSTMSQTFNRRYYILCVIVMEGKCLLALKVCTLLNPLPVWQCSNVYIPSRPVNTSLPWQSRTEYNFSHSLTLFLKRKSRNQNMCFVACSDTEREQEKRDLPFEFLQPMIKEQFKNMVAKKDVHKKEVSSI